MCENCKVFIKDIKKLSRPQASFLQQSSFNPSLGLASLSVSCVPRMPTFPYVQQPPDRPWRSEEEQRLWGCSQTRAESLPTDAMEDSLAGLMLPQIRPYHTPGTPVSVPWGPQCLETIGELLIQHRQRIWNYPVLRVGLPVYCRLPSKWQMWHPLSASRPHKYNRQEPRQTRSISQPGNTLNWEVITHELS